MIELPEAAYTAGEQALASYPFAQIDHLDAASDVLHAAAPLAVAAELRRLAQELIAEENPNVIWRRLGQRASELEQVNEAQHS
jgi:hypothetical protein